ncbi:hypothetical protein BH23GEM2_BH23GEM2_20330 [soil metagenome]
MTLDQTSVGPVSRIDALQNQAMSVDLHARNEAQRAQIVDALERIAAGTHGLCARCGKPIPVADRRSTLSAQKIRRDFPSVDFLGRGIAVFDPGGNRFRLVAHIRCDVGLVFVTHVVTHGIYRIPAARYTILMWS